MEISSTKMQTVFGQNDYILHPLQKQIKTNNNNKQQQQQQKYPWVSLSYSQAAHAVHAAVRDYSFISLFVC